MKKLILTLLACFAFALCGFGAASITYPTSLDQVGCRIPIEELTPMAGGKAKSPEPVYGRCYCEPNLSQYHIDYLLGLQKDGASIVKVTKAGTWDTPYDVEEELT